MTDDRLDRWRDRMVAALYDELDGSERAELEAELARDPELAREWRELQEVRAAIAAGGASDVAGQDLELVLPPRREEGGGWLRAAFAAGAGFAAAASLFAVLLLAGLRVDATVEGVTVRFAPAAPAQGGEAEPTRMPDAVAEGSGPVTREEFERFADLLVRATSARLDDLERRQTANQVELMGTLYDALAVDQRRQYQDLRARLDAAIVQAAMVDPGGLGASRR